MRAARARAAGLIRVKGNGRGVFHVPRATRAGDGAITGLSNVASLGRRGVVASVRPLTPPRPIAARGREYGVHVKRVIG